MAGFPLMAFGAGLGRAADSWRQQQYADAQSAYLRMALDKQRQENEGKDLVGLALSSGGLPGFGGAGTGIGPVGGGGGLPGSGMMPQPPAPPPQPQPAAQPPGATAAANVTTDPFYDEAGPRYDDRAMTAPEAPTPGGPAGRISLDDLAAPAAEPAPTAPAQPDAAQGPAQPAAGGFEPVGETKDGRVIFDVPNIGKMDLTSMFRQVDPTAIARRIKELRPNASNAAIASATESLYKLANSGSKAEQLQTATLLKYLSATRSQDIRQSEGAANRSVTTAGQQTRAGTAAAGRQNTADIAAANRGSREQNQALNRAQRERLSGTRQSDLQAQRAQAIATGQTKMQLGTLEKQMSDIRGRMIIIINGSNPSSPANKAAMDRYNSQLDELETRRDAIAGQVLGSREKAE